MFKALVLKEADGKVTNAIEALDESRLPEGDVTVRVSHSTLNYKDGMIVNGIGRLVRVYPHVPGVDFAGTVEASDHPDYKAGDQVLLTGWRVGETHWGGYAEKARVKGDWLVPLPEGLSAAEAMAVGTAGFTAMLAVQALERHGAAKDKGPILVTGASGGVGSVAVSLLDKAGFEVAAVTGRPEQADYLKSLGASQIVERAELAEAPARPLDKERWAGCIDSVGGTMLAHVLTQMAYGSTVAAVGAGRRQCARHHGAALPFARRGDPRDRLGDVPQGASPGRLGAYRQRPGPLAAGQHQHDRKPRAGAGLGQVDPEGWRAGARRRRALGGEVSAGKSLDVEDTGASSSCVILATPKSFRCRDNRRHQQLRVRVKSLRGIAPGKGADEGYVEPGARPGCAADFEFFGSGDGAN